MDEDGIPIIISINWATPVAGLLKYPWRAGTSKISFEDEQSPEKTKRTIALQKPFPTPLTAKEIFAEVQTDSDI